MPRRVKERALSPAAQMEVGPENSDSDSEPEQEIQVEFEGRTPQDVDFHGIKMLLQQLFLKAHVNLSEISTLIIGNNHIGSVIKQAEPEDIDEMEDDPEADADLTNDVFGITTLLSLDQKQQAECVHQIRQLLTDLVGVHASEKTKRLIETVLNSNSGLLINERLVNIPPQISLPLFESLSEEINKAIVKQKAAHFDYYLLICKIYKPDNQKNSKNVNEANLIWSNSEEEVISAEALDSFEFSVKAESDSGFTGNWLEDDNEMQPFRRILILDAKKMKNVVTAVRNFVS